MCLSDLIYSKRNLTMVSWCYTKLIMYYCLAALLWKLWEMYHKLLKKLRNKEWRIKPTIFLHEGVMSRGINFNLIQSFKIITDCLKITQLDSHHTSKIVQLPIIQHHHKIMLRGKNYITLMKKFHKKLSPLCSLVNLK